MLPNSSMKSKQKDLQHAQSLQVRKMLNLNKTQDVNKEEISVWKIIVYDRYCQDILSTLFKVGHLRDENITLHLNINNLREKVHGVSAIYFIQPTEENLKKLNEDFAKDLYDSIYINFASFVSNEYLNEIAKYALRSNAVYKIKQVYQHHLNFISINKDFFTLNIAGAYERLNNTSKDKSKLYDYISESLFSIFRCMKTIPNILYQNEQGEICEEIKKRLTDFFNDYRINKEFEEESNENSHYLDSNSQSLLILLQRNKDFSCPLLHPWHYGALIHDLLEIKNNKVEINNELTNNIKTEYDLDNQHDKFWAEKINVPFPYVSDDIDKELNDWKNDYESMGHKKLNKDSQNISNDLASALDMVPEMTEKKRRIDLHTNIATHLLNEVKNRQLDKYFELGSSMLLNKHLSHQEKQLFLALMQTKSCDYLEDKIRLLLLYYLCIDSLDFQECQKIENSLQINEESFIKALNYIKKQKNIVFSNKNDLNEEGNLLINPDNSLGLSFLKGLADKVRSHGKGFLKNVQSAILAETNFPIPRLIENIIDNKTNWMNEGFLYWDSSDQYSKLKENIKLNKVSDIYIFLVDGGCYNEYQNFCEISKRSNKKIFYGSSYIYNAKSLIKDFASCG